MTQRNRAAQPTRLFRSNDQARQRLHTKLESQIPPQGNPPPRQNENCCPQPDQRPPSGNSHDIRDTTQSCHGPDNKPRPNQSARTGDLAALHVAVRQLDAIFSPVLEFLLNVIKLSAIFFPIIAITLLISFSQNHSIPLPITTLSLSIFLLVYGGLFSVFYAMIVLSVIYPPLVVAADPHLNELSSHYPLFQTPDSQPQRSFSVPSSPSASAATAQSQGWLRRTSSRVQQCFFSINRWLNRLNLPNETKKSINFLILGFLAFIILVTLFNISGFIIFLLKLGDLYVATLLIITVICSIFGHYMLLPSETSRKFLVENFTIIILMNFFLFTAYFLIIMLIGRIYPSYSAILVLSLVLLFFILFIIVLLLLIASLGQILGASLVGILLFFFLLANIGFGRSAEIALRALNLGGGIPAQFVVKPEACAMLERNQAIENKDNGPDGELVSCTTKSVRVVFNVGDTVYFRSERMKHAEDVTIQYPEDTVLGLERQYIIGTQNVPERRNQQSQE